MRRIVSYFPTFPKSPWRASVGCRYVAWILSEFIVATSFFAICPLFPTPEMMSLPLSHLNRVIASTAELKPPRATGSVSYNRVRHDRAVASVPRTCTAFERRWLNVGEESCISGGVIDSKSSRRGDNARSQGVAGEGGDGGGLEGACEAHRR